MRGIIVVFVLAFIAGTFALPLQSYTVTGGENSIYDGTKRVLDTANSRYFEEVSFFAQSNTWVSQLIVLPTVTYRKTIANGVCSCKRQSNYGYANLTASWDDLSLVSNDGTVSTYTGSIKDAPACPSYSATSYTWTLGNTGSYPIYVSYPSSWGPQYVHITSSYSATVDSSVFNLGCCSSTTATIC